MIERLIEQLEQEKAQRERAIFSPMVKDFAVYERLRAEFHTLELAIDMAQKIAAEDVVWDESDVDA